MKSSFILLFLTFTASLFAQEERVSISGKTKNNYSTIENVHVYNKTSERGTVSNPLGDFTIFVKVKDTLIFSNIQFENQQLIITESHLKNNYLIIRLKQKNNKLEEVVLIESKNIAVDLGLPNAEKVPLKDTERKLNTIQKGGTIDKLQAWASGDKKKLETLQGHLEEDALVAKNKKNVQIIKANFGEDFVANSLQIPKDKIDGFIYYCLPKGIMPLFEAERHLEIVEIFTTSKETYLKNTQ